MNLALMGLSLGLAAGVSPGPLLTLVVTSTLQRGFGAGFRVALAPLLTDIPIIVLALWVLRDLPSSWMAWITTMGGCVVLYLGICTLRARPPDSEKMAEPKGSAIDLWRGAIVNLLNPHPWIFWVTVQGPLLIQGWRRDPLTGVAFVCAFYTTIVGSKIAIAWLVGRGRTSLDQRWYRRVLVICGLSLIGMGGFLIIQGLAPLL